MASDLWNCKHCGKKMNTFHDKVHHYATVHPRTAMGKSAKEIMGEDGHTDPGAWLKEQRAGWKKHQAEVASQKPFHYAHEIQPGDTIHLAGKGSHKVTHRVDLPAHAFAGPDHILFHLEGNKSTTLHKNTGFGGPVSHVQYVEKGVAKKPSTPKTRTVNPQQFKGGLKRKK